jgi:hypothetical protein
MGAKVVSGRARIRDRGIAPTRTRAIRAAGALVLAVLMALGCAVLWVGIPFGWFWLAGAVTDNATTFYVIALVGVPGTMIAWGVALARVNRVYLRLRGAQSSMLFHTLLVGSVLLALIAFLVWSVFFSGPPSATPWPDEFSGPGN